MIATIYGVPILINGVMCIIVFKSPNNPMTLVLLFSCYK